MKRAALGNLPALLAEAPVLCTNCIPEAPDASASRHTSRPRSPDRVFEATRSPKFALNLCAGGREAASHGLARLESRPMRASSTKKRLEPMWARRVRRRRNRESRARGR
eukprot:1351889-Pyramimonas_sp.AAC.2